MNIEITNNEGRLLLKLLKGETLNSDERQELSDVEDFIADSLEEVE